MNSDLDWKAWRFGYEYDFIVKDRGFAGLIAELKYTDVTATLTASAINEFAHAQAPIPAIGGIGRYYFVPNMSITGEVTAFDLPDNVVKNGSGHYVDVDIYGTLNFTDNVGVKAGYRSMDLGYVFKTDSGVVHAERAVLRGRAAVLRKLSTTEDTAGLTCARASLLDSGACRQRAFPSADRLPAASRPSCRSRTAASCGPAPVLVEAAARHGGDADVLHQIPRELDIVGEAERADVGHDVVRAVRLVAREVVALEDLEQHVAAAAGSPPARSV